MEQVQSSFYIHHDLKRMLRDRRWRQSSSARGMKNKSLRIRIDDVGGWPVAIMCKLLVKIQLLMHAPIQKSVQGRAIRVISLPDSEHVVAN